MAVQTASNPRELELRPLVIVSNCISSASLFPDNEPFADIEPLPDDASLPFVSFVKPASPEGSAFVWYGLRRERVELPRREPDLNVMMAPACLIPDKERLIPRRKAAGKALIARKEREGRLHAMRPTPISIAGQFENKSDEPWKKFPLPPSFARVGLVRYTSWMTVLFKPATKANPPSKKTMQSANFFFRSRCNFQTNGIGRTRRQKSIKLSNAKTPIWISKPHKGQTSQPPSTSSLKCVPQ